MLIGSCCCVRTLPSLRPAFPMRFGRCVCAPWFCCGLEGLVLALSQRRSGCALAGARGCALGWLAPDALWRCVCALCSV
eukprot:14988512-Alexandrium_andersonii.AAC.1